jgi:outer membrane protein assembly factor BamB
MRRILVFLPFLFFLSCNKNNDLESVPSLFYYDYYAYPASVDCKRVCVDLSHGSVLWEKANEKVMPYKDWDVYAGTAYGYAYSKNFIKDNYIVRIFPATDFSPYATQTVSGIYFQKIDKKTGEQLVLQKLVTQSEINQTSRYRMTGVVTDGERYFFACNNNYVYCIDANGSIVWKKNYAPTNLNDNGYLGYGFIYYDQNRIYFPAYDPAVGFKTMYALNALTGQLVWQTTTDVYPAEKQLVFMKDVYVEYDKDGSTDAYRKSDGMQVGYAFGASYTGIKARPVGKLTDSSVVCFSTNNNLEYFKINQFQSPPIDIQGVGNAIDNNFIFDGQKIYGGGGIWNSTNFEFFCIDPEANNPIQWRINFPQDMSNGIVFQFYNYFKKGNYIYLFTNFYEQNNTVVRNASGEGCVIVLDASTGKVVQQLTHLPIGGLNSWGMFNIAID